MAVVVVLMGIFLTLGLAAFNAQTGNAALSTTKKKQEIIRDALIAYLRDFRRLPCPEVRAFDSISPTGVESRKAPVTNPPTTICSSYWGTVPYAELGLSRDVAIDGYENFFTYFVSSAQAPTEPDWTLTQNMNTGIPGFSVGNFGRFAVKEKSSDTVPPRNLAVVVVVSHGSNGFGAYTSKGTLNEPPSDADEIRNATSNEPLNNWNLPTQNASELPPPGIKVLIAHDRTETFDDVVMALRPNDLLMPLIRDGALKSAEALIQEQLVTVRDTAIAQMLATACTPVAGIANLPTDPWGTPIYYNKIGTEQLTATASSDQAFQIWSAGPDRVNNLGNSDSDDRVLTTGLNITYVQVRNWIPKEACPNP